jgi:hypothetical protein
MKAILIALLLISSFAPLSFAATDCARNCCRDYNAGWDNDADNCFQPKAGYDTCVSQCEAAAAASGPVGPDQSKTQHYTCFSIGAILFAVAGTAALASAGRRKA